MLIDSNRHFKEEIDALREENQWLRRQLFGSKSDKVEHGKIDIEIEQTEQGEGNEESSISVPNQAEEKKRTRRLNVRYSRKVVEVLIPEEVMKNPNGFKRLPDSCTRESYRVEIVPAHTKLHIYQCPGFVRIGKRGKGKESAPIYANAPGTVLPGSQIGSSVLANLIWNRFGLQLPLYRQIKEFDKKGIQGVSEEVLCNWIKACAKSLKPIWQTMHGLLLESEALQVDETPIRCLKADVEKGTMWAMNSADDNMCLYYWCTSRGKNVLDTLLREGMKPEASVYGGAVVSDGYQAYASWLKALPEEQRPKWQNCWAHVRRKFVEAMEVGNDPSWCARIVELIRPLYQIERELRESKAPPEEILRRRGEESRALVSSFFKELEKRIKDLSNPPLNKLKNAITYALERQEQLVSWLDNPYIPIDNNAVERAIRPLTVGRRNSLFIGSPAAGERSAILYTMVQECKRMGVDCEAWLTEVLRILPNYQGDYFDLLPGKLPLPDTKVAGEKQI